MAETTISASNKDGSTKKKITSVCINSGCRYWRGSVCESREFCVWRRK